MTSIAQAEAEFERKKQAHLEQVVRPMQRELIFGNEDGELCDFVPTAEMVSESYAESKRGFGGNTTPRRAPRR